MNAAFIRILPGIAAMLLCCPLLSMAQGKYQTLGLGGCGSDQNNCHAKEYKSYKNDPHYKTLEKLGDDEDKARGYGDKLGIKNIYAPSATCMKCHGTVVSGKSTVEDGVSCENCHGPGSGYKEVHKEGTGGGTQRPGYIKGLQAGMTELKNLDLRAKTCVGCHYITDQKLVATGHKNGAGFNFVSGIKTVAKHWKRPITPEETQKALFTSAMNARGPAAQVANAPPPPAQKAMAAQDDTPAGVKNTSGAEAARPARRPPPPPRTPAPEPMPPAATGAPSDQAAAPSLSLPPFPSLNDSMPVSRQLLLVKRRIELLYQKAK